MFRTASNLATEYRSGRLNPEDVTDHYLQKIEAENPDIRAFVQVFAKSARAAASAAHKAFRQGQDLGPLQGIPVAVKDLVTTSEGKTGAGTTFLANYLAQKDAQVITRLRQQGAIIIGKTTLTEGAFSVHHPEIQTPRNPWSPDHWTGVSSSGSAVALAAGLAPLAIGSDTGGSIRLPSACNRLVGLKAGFDAISSEGCFPLAQDLDHIGPMARTVADCEMLFLGMADDAAKMTRQGLKHRLGLDRRLLETVCDDQVQGLIQQVLAEYVELGFEIVEVDLGQTQEALAASWIMSVATAAARHHAPYSEAHNHEYGAAFKFLLQLGEDCSEEQLLQISASARSFSTALDQSLESIDALVCPVMPTGAMRIEQMKGSPPSQDEMTRSMMYTAPYNYSGHPALTLPAGFIDVAPSGYQLIARKQGEGTLFSVAKQHETLLNWTGLTLPTLR